MPTLTRTHHRIAGLTAWGASLLGILSVERIGFGGQHTICGAWGCGPTVPSLIAWHGFWTLLLVVPGLITCSRLRPSQAVKASLAIFLPGIVAALGIMSWAAFDWVSQQSNAAGEYIVQRSLFVLVTQVDIPVVGVLLAGAILLGFCLYRSRNQGAGTAVAQVQPGP